MARRPRRRFSLRARRRRPCQPVPAAMIMAATAAVAMTTAVAAAAAPRVAAAAPGAEAAGRHLPLHLRRLRTASVTRRDASQLGPAASPYPSKPEGPAL